VNDYPAMIAPVNHVEPVPRRVRAQLAGETVFDTTRALYVWEWPYYPQYYIPRTDVRDGLLVPEEHSQHTARGLVGMHGLHVGGTHRPRAAKVLRDSPVSRLSDTVRFEWAALDTWLEEDEQIFVHPRNPYVRVDALRSTRTVRVEINGTVLGQSSAPIMVFETGLPTRYYLNRTEINFEHMIPTSTVTECPYKCPPGTRHRHSRARRRTRPASCPQHRRRDRPRLIIQPGRRCAITHHRGPKHLESHRWPAWIAHSALPAA